MKKTNNEKFEVIAAHNNELINDVISLGKAIGCKYYNPTQFVKDLLEITRSKKDHLIILNVSIKELENSYNELLNDVGKISDGYSDNDQGKQNGGKGNTEELRALKKYEQLQEFKTIIDNKKLKRNDLQIAIEKSNKVVSEFINLLPQRDYVDILQAFYLERKSQQQIMERYDYFSYDKIRKSLELGHKFLGIILNVSQTSQN